MIVTTTENISGKKYEILGLVRGSMIESKHIGKDITQSLKTIIGGELKSYTEMMEQSREEATRRMVADAEKKGADAVVCVRYTSSSVVQNAAEVTAYGTAVKFVR